jgi:hypothetical protein
MRRIIMPVKEPGGIINFSLFASNVFNDEQ